ncbi:response regulator [Anaerocolumna sp. AGMB13020]|uniref:response regulator n=1 Tax=Anaerocolumna sp. AGMB13020 TaxID=3081750 RepID=UPI0029555468|nr:response regulator [Anaerocolumna sp. AGMB13020]WOO38140.1 response regulator [Anaerocolumna sp. AGMB13020]
MPGSVLIVDDAIFMRRVIREMLEKNGYEVVGEAENGKIAIQKYKEHKPDIVTLDITMPEMSGSMALKEIMNLDQAAKVIMVTAMGQEELVKEAIIAGARSFIVKPFTEEKLIQVLQKIT